MAGFLAATAIARGPDVPYEIASNVINYPTTLAVMLVALAVGIAVTR
jgi:hypothetical protein